MFDQSFSFILTIAALVVGVMLFTGHGSFFMKGGNTQARAQKYDEKKMEKVLSNLVQTMEDEQGVTFTYKKNYGTYENSQGRSTSGWLVEFTKK